MMNGSANGSSSSYSSTRAMRIGWQVEEPELAVVSLELAARLELEHARDQALLRMKYERVERPLGTGAVRGGVLGKGKLEEGVHLHALPAAAGILEDHAAGPNIPSAGECREPRTCVRGQLSLQHSQIAVAQVPAPVSNSPRQVEQPSEDHERVRL